MIVRVAVGLWVGLAFLFVMGLQPGWSQPVTPADGEAIRAVVEQQLDAFRHNDAEAAFSFASPFIQEKFGTPANFMHMVKTAYAPVYRPRRVVFLSTYTLGIEANISAKVFFYGCGLLYRSGFQVCYH